MKYILGLILAFSLVSVSSASTKGIYTKELAQEISMFNEAVTMKCALSSMMSSTKYTGRMIAVSDGVYKFYNFESKQVIWLPIVNCFVFTVDKHPEVELIP